MNPTTFPTICGIALTSMVTAGISHWWTVREISYACASGAIAPLQPSLPEDEAPPTIAPAPNTPVSLATTAAVNAPATAEVPPREFYEALLSRMESIQTQNRDLLDQLAETNRDLMKLEFRVDTHSESFRPLPVSEDRPFTRLDTDPGVLPPRAEPVLLPSYE
jgi:hypothetical protein